MGSRARDYLVSCVVVGCWTLAAWGQPPPSTAPAREPATPDTPQVRQLQATIDRQAAEIEQLKAVVAALTRQLADAGLTPAIAGPSTQPAKAPQKVLFLIHCGGGSYFIQRPERSYTEVAKALDDLRPPQSFSILVSTGQGYVSMQRGFFIPATPENRRRAGEFMGSQRLGYTALAEGLKRAIGWDPDVIWVLAVGEVKDGEEVLKAVKEANATRHVAINTHIGFTHYPRDAGNHVLWKLAKENNGTCVNEKGEPVDEPVVPAVVTEPKKDPAPTKPSVLKVR